MWLSAHQPAYLPWTGYFHKIWRADRFVILDDVQFSRGDFIERNKIAVKQGDPWLTIPLVHKSPHKKISELEILRPDWPRDHRRKMEANYGGCGWVGAVWSLHMEAHCRDFIGVTAGFVSVLCEYFEIDTPIDYQSQIGVTGHKAELIVNLCKHYGADAFLFGTEGYDNYGQEVEKYGIRAIRQEYVAPDEPKLSIMHYLITRKLNEVRGLICG